MRRPLCLPYCEYKKVNDMKTVEPIQSGSRSPLSLFEIEPLARCS